MTRLDQLGIGGRAHVTQVDGIDAISIRLMEMGLIPGVEVSIRGAAPLGDPIEIELQGYRLSLRKSEAARVAVELPV